jgi:hypothetical protein
MKKNILCLFIIVLFVPGLYAQEYYEMLKANNRLENEKTFASQYKIKSIKWKKYCPGNKDSSCYFGEDYSYKKMYDKLGNLIYDSASPYAYYIYKSTYIYKNGKLEKEFNSMANDYGGYFRNFTYKYDSFGNISEQEIHYLVLNSGDNETCTKKIYYYENGHMKGIEEMEKGADSLYHSTASIRVVYDSIGNMIEETHYSNLGKREDIFNYIYDITGNFLKITHTGQNEIEPLVIYTFAYDNTGDTTLISSRNNDNTIVSVAYVYNDLHNKTEEFCNDQDRPYHIYYKYNVNGKLNDITIDNNNFYKKIQYFYNNMGLVSEKQFFDKDNHYTYSEKYIYEYFE